MLGNDLGGFMAVMSIAGLSVIGVILTVAWIILPFAMLGTKPLLRELVVEQRKGNALLEHLARSSDEQRKILSALVEKEGNHG